MVITVEAIAQSSLSLEEFLQLPETKPYSEYIEGKIEQKPMAQGHHSVLQGRLATIINEKVLTTKIAYALPELRCTFGGRAIVPDISVFSWQRIPKDERGRIANRFETHPDWVIEILSQLTSHEAHSLQQWDVLRHPSGCSKNYSFSLISLFIAEDKLHPQLSAIFFNFSNSN